MLIEYGRLYRLFDQYQSEIMDQVVGRVKVIKGRLNWIVSTIIIHVPRYSHTSPALVFSH